MAVDISVMLVIRVLGTKESGAKRTCEMVDVVLLVAGSDVGAPQCHPAGRTYEV